MKPEFASENADGFPNPSQETAAQPVGGRSIRRVLVRNLVLDSLIGVHRHERDGRQRVRINLDLAVEESDAPLDDRLTNVVSYETIVKRIREIVDSGHVNLVETLAERVAEACLAEGEVLTARVRVEKLDIFSDAESVGVEIVRPR